MAAVPGEAEVIVVHDAARPLAGAELWSAVVAAVAGGADAAIPGIPVSDTIKRLGPSGALQTLDRSELIAVQTPQAFRAGALRAAHQAGGEASDDAALVEAAGGHVVVVPGDPDNVKLTCPSDLDVLSALLGRRLRTGTP
jgi:2-C-methyl-D-erythritol 4-phosphate cytidylyltransferase